MSNLDPSAPSQPSLNTAYDQPANPASTSEAEDRTGSSISTSQQRSAPTQETRQQNDVLPGGDKDQKYAQPTSLAQGVHSNQHDNPTALSDPSMGPASNTEGEQMRAAGEGEIASAQDTKDGFGEEESLTRDLDQKKVEQGFEREKRRNNNDDGEGGGGGGVDLKRAMEGKEGAAFVPAESNADANASAGGQRQGIVGGGDDGGGGGLGMQSGHGQV